MRPRFFRRAHYLQALRKRGFFISDIAGRDMARLPSGTSLSMLMEPHEIASIPGLPDHVYEGLGIYGDPGGRQNTDTATPKNPIGPVQGYPEDGKHAWRTGNDDVIVEAVGRYNTANKLLPGDSAYMAPKL